MGLKSGFFTGTERDVTGKSCAKVTGRRENK